MQEILEASSCFIILKSQERGDEDNPMLLVKDRVVLKIAALEVHLSLLFHFPLCWGILSNHLIFGKFSRKKKKKLKALQIRC